MHVDDPVYAGRTATKSRDVRERYQGETNG